MSDPRIPAADVPDDLADETALEDVPETAGPVEDVTPATGAIGRPDLGANPFA